jgi:hypothetical protein
LNLNNEEARVNEDYYTKGILEAGMEGALIKNDKMFNEVKSGTWSQTFNTPNMNYKVGAIDGERYVQYEQKNVESVRQYCKERRDFYKMIGNIFKLDLIITDFYLFFIISIYIIREKRNT